MELIKVLLTTVLSAFVLFVITKLIGKKQFSQLDIFDYVTGITIGSIGAELATELEDPLKPLTAMIAWARSHIYFLRSRTNSTDRVNI